MTTGQVLDIFRATGALLEGHFKYTSGKHGPHFLQASKVLQHPNYCERMCKAIAELFKNDNIEMVVGPAMGGVILAYETARHLECRAAFTEKTPDGGMAIKRGIRVPQGTNVLVVEDIITTGGSVQKTIDHLRSRGARIAGVSVLVDRSGGVAAFDVPYRPLAYLALQAFDAASCPACADGAPLMNPDDMIV
ncbi:MAG: hypothetical protein AMXMBFR84_22830 [Candidatus Hydrogenedentota bacterium]